MNRFPRIASRIAAAAAVLLAAGTPALAGGSRDYANAWLGEQLRREIRETFWRDLVARPSRHEQSPAPGPRSWQAHDQNPWANTYGTPENNRWRSTVLGSRSPGIVRMCSCYLSADARSWDGGPLTEADITRMCRAQCY